MFDEAGERAAAEAAPLAVRMRPRTLDEVIGQRHLTAAGTPFRKLIENDAPMSLVVHPRCGGDVPMSLMGASKSGGDGEAILRVRDSEMCSARRNGISVAEPLLVRRDISSWGL